MSAARRLLCSQPRRSPSCVLVRSLSTSFSYPRKPLEATRSLSTVAMDAAAALRHRSTGRDLHLHRHSAGDPSPSSSPAPSSASLLGHGHSHSHGGHSHGIEETQHLASAVLSLTRNPSSLDPGSKITLVGLVSNVGLTVIKGAAGYLLASSALLADAAHSGSDLIADVVTLASYRIGRWKPSQRYPYGYGSASNRSALKVECTQSLADLGRGRTRIRIARVAGRFVPLVCDRCRHR